MDRIWKKSYLAKSLCGWFLWSCCSCQYVFHTPTSIEGWPTHRPEIVHQNIEHTQNHDQNDRTPLRLKPHHNHHTRHRPKRNHDQPPRAPIPGKHKAHKQKNQQHAPRELEVHLAVLLVDLRQAGGGELLAHPAVGEDHEQAAHDAEVAQEEVEVEDEAVAEGLGDDDGDEARDGVLGVAAGDDEGAAGDHGADVEDEEEVC